MLVLTRRIGETIVIAGNIRVTVVAVQGERIRLGISAPPSMPVHRQEIHDRIGFVAPPDPVAATSWAPCVCQLQDSAKPAKEE